MSYFQSKGERSTKARLASEGDGLRTQLAERDQQVEELAPYRRLVDRAEDWVWVVDEHGKLSFSNAAGAALLGYDELTGRTLADLTPPDDLAAGWAGIVRRRHADGSWRTVDSRSVRSGEGWQGIDRDLTEITPKRVGFAALVRIGLGRMFLAVSCLRSSRCMPSA